MVTRLGGVQRFAVRRHAETALQVGGAAVHKAGADDGMALELPGQGCPEGVPLKGVARHCGCLDGGEFVIVEASAGMGRPQRGLSRELGFGRRKVGRDLA